MDACFNAVDFAYETYSEKKNSKIEQVNSKEESAQAWTWMRKEFTKVEVLLIFRQIW